MKQLFLIIASAIFLPIKAQNICLKILDKSIQVQDDSLRFRIEVSNKDTIAYVLYNISYPNYNFIKMDSLMSIAMPRLLVSIFDEKNELPKILRAKTGSINFSKFSIIDKYHVIKQKETKEYDIAISLWHVNLKSGSYKLQLMYFSNDYYKMNYNKAKKIDVNLKGSFFFKGIIKSNTCTLFYPPAEPR